MTQVTQTYFQSRKILLTGRRSNEQIVRIVEQAYLDMVAAVPGDRGRYHHLKQAGSLNEIE